MENYEQEVECIDEDSLRAAMGRTDLLSLKFLVVVKSRNGPMTRQDLTFSCG